MTGHVARMEEGSRVLKILTDEPTGNILLGRCRSRKEDTIKMYLKEIGVDLP